MKNFRRLLKDFWRSLLTLAFIGLIVLAAVILSLRKSSLEAVVMLIVCYLIFSILAFIAVLIYSVLVLTAYANAKSKLRSIPGFDVERFARETVRMPKIKNLVLCSDAICFVGQYSQAVVIPIRDIVWVYQEQVQNALVVQIYTRDKEGLTVQIVMKKKYGNREMACRFLLRLIARKNKGTLIGYNKEYDKLFQSNFRRLLEMTEGKEVTDSRWLEQEYIRNDYYTRDLQ